MNLSVIGKGHFEKREELLSQKWRKFCQTTIPTARRSPGKKTLRMLRYRKNVTWTVFLKYVTVVSKGIDFHKGTGVKLIVTGEWRLPILDGKLADPIVFHRTAVKIGCHFGPLLSLRCSIKHILAPLPNSDSERFTGQCLPVQRQMFLNTAEEVNNSTLTNFLDEINGEACCVPTKLYRRVRVKIVAETLLNSATWEKGRQLKHLTKIVLRNYFVYISYSRDYFCRIGVRLHANVDDFSS